VPQRIVMPAAGGGPNVELHGISTKRGGAATDFDACAFATLPPASAVPASRAYAALTFSLPDDIIHLGCVTAARRRRLVCRRPSRHDAQRR
jgi:hypothetical protein